MSNAPWSETISIDCQFERSAHTYTLVYLPKGQGMIVTTLDNEAEKSEDKPQGKECQDPESIQMFYHGKTLQG